MILIFLRHGEAEDRGPNVDDPKRRLTPAGRRDVRKVARGLAAMKVTFSMCLSSPLARARETADVACQILGIAEVKVVDGLLPSATWEELLSQLEEFPGDVVLLLVGHEPSMSHLIAAAIGAPEARIEIRKTGVARVDVDSPGLPGELKWLLKPKQAIELGG